MTLDEFTAECRDNPEGPAGKYLDPTDRLDAEAARSWGKAQDRLRDQLDDPRAEPPPTAPPVPVAVARDHVTREIRAALARADGWRRADPQMRGDPPVTPIAVTTGVGKTSIAIREIAAHLRARIGAGEKPRAIMYFVPRHRLGDHIAEDFAAEGISARVFRGREAEDPGQPATADAPAGTMCRKPDAVRLAIEMNVKSVEEACCRHKPKGKDAITCEFYETCAYQKQKKAKPQVWIVSHEYLFMAMEMIKEVDLIVIDESFWEAGLKVGDSGIALDTLAEYLPLTKPKPGRVADDTLHNDVEPDRQAIARAMREQAEAHGAPSYLRLDILARHGFTEERLTDALSREWELFEEFAPKLVPGMSPLAVEAAGKAVPHARTARRAISLWSALRAAVRAGHEVTGWVEVVRQSAKRGGALAVKVRGLREIRPKWQVPAIILDATMPPGEVLRGFFPQAANPVRIEAATPHVRYRAVLDAPVAKSKLEDKANVKADDDEDERSEDPEEHKKIDEERSEKKRIETKTKIKRNLNRIYIERYIRNRFVELGRKPLLVIAQKHMADWLKSRGLPSEISVEHFNNISGTDSYKHVRGLIVVGRPMPMPHAVEAFAAALTGRVPEPDPDIVQEAKREPEDEPDAGTEAEPQDDAERAGSNYGRQIRKLRLAGGGFVGVECAMHPNRVAEMFRALICDAEVLQAIGRARGVNRTEGEPLNIDILADLCLPIIFDEVVYWEPPEADTEMLADGVVLTSPSDMSRAWPNVWKDNQSAKDWMHVRKPSQDDLISAITKKVPRVLLFKYQHQGARQKWRCGAYDPAVVKDIRAWLETRVGPMAKVEVIEAERPASPEPASGRPDRAGDPGPDARGGAALSLADTSLAAERGPMS
ncbi:hypothetical protein [Methylobacterium sp. WSM2598]|uniref:hypothetical protein n=1 Tax=Methylobacterium sp. WSM2598 TaxID=398261 RepID=UPI00036CEFCB|nr:hypothetical protein [Methylobacterium sp. WSM2598]